jgi:D-methionine transport system substrate-binding protein
MMKKKNFLLILFLLVFSVLFAACGTPKEAKETNVGAPSADKPATEKKEIRIGATAGPYSDQVNKAIKPYLEKKGYKVSIIEFNDYIQPNLALAEGSLDFNVFQHEVYLKKFAKEHNLDLTDVIKVPTAPIGIYSKKHKSLDEGKDGVSVSLPNDPTNEARALVMLNDLGWIKLKASIDPIRVSEKDIEKNNKNIKLIPLEAAQLPRSLDDSDFAFVNGNFALASGLKLTEALALEKTPDRYLNLVAIKTADKDQQFVKDVVDAYKSQEFKEVIDKGFAGFVRPDYIK